MEDDLIENGNCILCGKQYEEYGNNPEPLKKFEDGRCCKLCDDTKVIPARLKEYYGKVD